MGGGGGGGGGGEFFSYRNFFRYQIPFLINFLGRSINIF